jgi:prolipoprotein diacylglyceryltransferase
MEFTLLGSAAIAVFLFWAMLRWEAKRGNAAGCATNLWDAGITSAAIGLLGGRIVAMLEAGINPLTNPAQILLIRSGVSTAAAAVIAVATFAFLARKDLVHAADAITPAALSGLAGWHLGCLPTGSCLGTESTLPWSQTLPGSTVTRHPVELYAAAALLLSAIALALWKQYGRPPLGSVTGFGFIAAGGVRLATEPLRTSLGSGPNWIYLIAVIAGTGMVVASVLASRRSRRPA